MGMRTSTALNHVEEFERIVRDALNPHASHREALDRVTERVFHNPAYNRMPAWARSRITTVFSERVHSAHVFGAIRWALYRNPETGQILHKWDDLTEALKAEFMRKENPRTGFHYWVKTGRVF